MAPAVNKLMLQLYDSGKAIIIPTSMALKIDGVHFSATHWALKKGKVWGRWLPSQFGDASAAEGDGCPLNSDRVKALVSDLWGPIEHPTLRGLSEMVMRQVERVGWDNLVLWKMDLRGAFTLLFVEAGSVKRLAFELTDKLTLMYITGMFGWTGMPYAFQVVTRILVRIINADLAGECLMYVDDLMGACSLAELEAELKIAREKCNGLLGENAVEDTKTQFGRRIEWIGWLFDLDTRSVSVARHNFLKTLHGFMSTHEGERVRGAQMLKLASWAARYSAVCRSLRPFTRDLFNEVKGLRSKSVLINLSASAVRTIWLWRVSLILLELQPQEFSRPLLSLVWRPITYVIEYDASLTGIGLVLSKLEADGVTKSLLKVVKVALPFHLGDDSGYQNSVEFIAVVLGVGCLGTEGVRGASIRVVGDNTSSLAWSVKSSFRDGPSRSAAMCLMSLGDSLGIEIVEGVHVPGLRNVVCDGLSRDKMPAEFGFADHDCIDFGTSIVLRTLLETCNPLNDTESEDGFTAVWTASRCIGQMFQ
jgi:hypothetical protein